MLLVFVVCVPVPALALSGLAIPLPGVVERIGAALVPWANAATLDDASLAASTTRGKIVLAPGSTSTVDAPEVDAVEPVRTRPAAAQPRPSRTAPSVATIPIPPWRRTPSSWTRARPRRRSRRPLPLRSPLPSPGPAAPSAPPADPAPDPPTNTDPPTVDPAPDREPTKPDVKPEPVDPDVKPTPTFETDVMPPGARPGADSGPTDETREPERKPDLTPIDELADPARDTP